MADVLVVTSSVRMVHGVHGHAAHPGPAVPLHAELVVGVAGLEQRLLRPAAAGDLPDHRAAVALHQLLGARRELHPACVHGVRQGSYRCSIRSSMAALAMACMNGNRE